MPVMAAHPWPCFTIAGSSRSRSMGRLGAWYSAIPRACMIVLCQVPSGWRPSPRRPPIPRSHLPDRPGAVMPAASKAMRDLIADNHSCQHSAPAKPQLLTQRQRCWKNLSTLMSACIDAPVVAIQTVGRAGVGKGCSGSRRTPVVQQDRCLVSLPRHGGVRSSDVADRRQPHPQWPQQCQPGTSSPCAARPREGHPTVCQQ